MSVSLALIPLGLVLFLGAIAAGGLLVGLIHLLVILIILAIVYYIFAWVLGELSAPPVVTKLAMVLCAVIALYFIAIFLLSFVP